MMLRARMLVLIMLLSACGATPTTQTGGVAQTSIVPSEATAPPTKAITPTAAMVATPTVAVEPSATFEAGEETATSEVGTATTSGVETSSTASAGGAAPITAVMEQLGVEGEPFAAVGDPNAPITVIEFSDYGWPFCRRYVSSTYPVLKQEYIDTGKVYYVFKDLPIKQLHPQAEIAAQAAECAGEQGRFWDMHAALFADPSVWDTTEDAARSTMTRYAETLALDAADFATCMEPGTPARANVESNIAEGQRLGLTGTPSFVINGKLLAGAQPLDVFKRVFERELKSAE